MHIYPLIADLARARRLVHRRHGTAIIYTSTGFPALRRAQIYTANLHAIGIDIVVKTFRTDNGALYTQARTKGAAFDIIDTGWAYDYLDPSDDLNVLLDGRTIQAKGNNNLAYFNDPAYNRRLDAASKLTGARRTVPTPGWTPSSPATPLPGSPGAPT